MDLVKARLYDVGFVNKALFHVRQTVLAQLHSLRTGQLHIRPVFDVQLGKERFQVVQLSLLALRQQQLLLSLLTTSSHQTQASTIDKLAQ